MFSEKISIFETFDSAPVAIPLGRWLKACTCGNQYKKQVVAYRSNGHDNIKKSLPLATVGAVCGGGRKLKNVVTRTGWIALDVDAKDNPKIKNAARLRNDISKITYVAFAGLSVSGKGVWALVKVKDPEKQAQYFEQLKLDFKSRGIILDSTKGKNPNDARFYSFDPDAYITNEFKIYDRLPKEKHEKLTGENRQSTKRTYKGFKSNGTDTRAKVEQLISKMNTDITTGYQNWLDLGFALEDEFGERGRDYFHAISQYHSDYNRRECDRQFSHCLKHKGSGIGIGTFFHVCKAHGITLNNNLNGSQPKYESPKNKNPAPYGYNPYTGEVFDKRGYPSCWDDIEIGPIEEIKKRDATFATLHSIFEPEPIINPN